MIVKEITDARTWRNTSLIRKSNLKIVQDMKSLQDKVIMVMHLLSKINIVCIYHNNNIFLASISAVKIIHNFNRYFNSSSEINVFGIFLDLQSIAKKVYLLFIFSFFDVFHLDCSSLPIQFMLTHLQYITSIKKLSVRGCLWLINGHQSERW